MWVASSVFFQKLGTSTESRSKDANVSFDDQLIPLVVFIQMFTSVWQLCIELYETLIECQRLLSLLALCRNLLFVAGLWQISNFKSSPLRNMERRLGCGWVSFIELVRNLGRGAILKCTWWRTGLTREQLENENNGCSEEGLKRNNRR